MKGQRIYCISYYIRLFCKIVECLTGGVIELLCKAETMNFSSEIQPFSPTNKSSINPSQILYRLIDSTGAVDSVALTKHTQWVLQVNPRQ